MKLALAALATLAATSAACGIAAAAYIRRLEQAIQR